MRVVSRVVLAALLAVAGRAGAQEPPAPAAPVPEAVQNELRSVQELLARAAVEFDGPEQSRSIVLLDEVVGRLEAFRRQGTLPGSAWLYLPLKAAMRTRGVLALEPSSPRLLLVPDIFALHQRLSDSVARDPICAAIGIAPEAAEVLILQLESSPTFTQLREVRDALIPPPAYSAAASLSPASFSQGQRASVTGLSGA